MLLHKIYKKDPDYYRPIFDSSSKESLLLAPGSSESKDLDLLREIRRNDSDLFHQIFDSNDKESSPLGSGSNESNDLNHPDLQNILARINMHTAATWSYPSPNNTQKSLRRQNLLQFLKKTINHRRAQGDRCIWSSTAAISADTAAISSGQPDPRRRGR